MAGGESGAVSTLGNIWRWLRWEFTRHTAYVATPRWKLALFSKKKLRNMHVQAKPHTLLSFELGDRCIYCLAHPSTEKWERPCSRMRPNMTELA